MTTTVTCTQVIQTHWVVRRCSLKAPRERGRQTACKTPWHGEGTAMKAWVARAGKYGEREDYDLENNVVAIGWSEVGDLSAATSREQVREIVDVALPAMSDAAKANNTGQLFAFAHTMQVGDLIVLPCKTSGTIAVGKITGDYHYAPDKPSDVRHSRPVEWLQVELPRGNFGQDLLYSLGSALTVFSVKRNNAVARLAKIAETGSDPGAATQIGIAATPAGPADDDVEPTEGTTPVDIDQIAADRIIAYVSERFAGHRLAQLVEALLQAEGYTTRFSPPGPDGGIDVLAGSGPLGLDPPRLAVQVKSNHSPVDVVTVRDLQGAASTLRADTALLVAWGGLNKPARDHVKNLWFSFRVWTSQDIIRKVTENYEALPAEIQAELPLKRIWTLALDENG